MMIKTTSLAFAAACLMTVSAMPAAHAQIAGGTQVITNGPQTDPGDVSSPWSARQNVIESQRYERLLQNEPWLSPGADAKGVRSDHRPATSCRLSGEL